MGMRKRKSFYRVTIDTDGAWQVLFIKYRDGFLEIESKYTIGEGNSRTKTGPAKFAEARHAAEKQIDLHRKQCVAEADRAHGHVSYTVPGDA